MIIALIVAVSVALTGGVSYAAEQSLPGDALYVVKTSINEPVLEALTVTAKGKAEWESRRVERRLEEAEALATEGELSEELRLAVEQQLQTRIDDVKSRIEKFQSRQDLGSAAEVSARLEVALRAHNQILEKLTLKFDGETKAFHDKVKEKHKESADDAEEAEDAEEQDVDDDKDENRKQHAVEGKQKAAENKIMEVTSFVMKAKVSEETRLEADARLKAIDADMSAARALYAAGDYEGAFEAFRDAHREAQEVKAFVAAEQATSVRIELNKESKEDRRGRDDGDRDDDREEEDEDRDDDEDENDEDDDEDEREDDEDEDDDRRGSLNLRVGLQI